LNNNYKKRLACLKKYSSVKDSSYIRERFYEREGYLILKKNNEIRNKELRLENEIKIKALKAEKANTLKLGLALFSALFFFILVVLFKRYRDKQKTFTAIKEKNAENALLMKEIHHRVKNNLQIISGLLDAKISTNTHNEPIKVALQESQNKIQSMAIIHQNLYKGNQFTEVAINTYIDELIAQIKSSFNTAHKPIVFQLDIAPNEIPMGLAVPLGLILNELITNAYKYAFTEQAKKENIIKISFHQLENTTKYRLIVKDNGKGLPDDFNVDELSSFGLQLVYGLTAQLHGEVITTQDNGATFTILFLNSKTNWIVYIVFYIR